MKDLRAHRGDSLMQRLVAEGEHVHQDFKYVINDARKIARSISAFANNDGGSLLIGVKDNGTIAGVRNEEDVYVVEQAAHLYCQPAQNVEFDAIKCAGGVVVIRASVSRAARRPVYVDEGGGRRRAYFRVADENIAAHPLMLRAWQLASSTGSEDAVALAADELIVLKAVNEAVAPLTPQTLTTNVLMSSRRVADIVSRLVAIGVLDFAYNGHDWVLEVIN